MKNLDRNSRGIRTLPVVRSSAPSSTTQLRTQFRFLASILDALDAPFYVIRVADHAIVLANRAARALGIERAHTCHALTHRRETPCEGEEHPCPMKLVLERGRPCVVEHLHVRPDGSVYHAEVHGYPLLNADGKIEHMVEYSLDITARRDAEAQLRLLQRAVEHSASGVMITDEGGVIIHVNAALMRMSGYSSEELVGTRPSVLKSGRHVDLYADLWGTIRRGEVWRGEMTNRRKTGEEYWEYQTIAPVKDPAGRITHYVAIKEDITERKRAEQEMERLATTDSLTGLSNRRQFFRRGEVLFGLAADPCGDLAALMVDLDHFKKINDTHGHAVGDVVLREAASRMAGAVRSDDLIARCGGEEFAVLLPRTNCEVALAIAERLRQGVCSRPIDTPAGDLAVTASVGVASLTEPLRSLDELLQRADQALYEAKNTGRNRCVVRL